MSATTWLMVFAMRSFLGTTPPSLSPLPFFPPSLSFLPCRPFVVL